MKRISSILVLAILVIAVTFNACKKEDNTVNSTTSPGTTTETFTSLADFFNRYGVHNQTYTIDGVAGGSFTSPQGTVVSIPANAFRTIGGLPVTGSVTITFKDIYKKSDMMLAQMGTMNINGQALVSGGEFNIKAEQGGAQVLLASGKKIAFAAPTALTGGTDTSMTGYTGVDTAGSNTYVWQPNLDSISTYTTSYLFSLPQFSYPSATWINCDHPVTSTYTNLTFHPTDTTSLYSTRIFVFLTSINTNIELYPGYPWNYAPLGYQATMVAIGERNGKLYSSFVPITITSNLTVNFTLTQTTSAAFITYITSLN